MDTAARRRELRQRLAERRRALTPPQRMAAAQGLRRSLELLPEYHTDHRVAGYWACDGELPLNLVIPPLASRGQQFLLPLIGQDDLLRFAPWAATMRWGGVSARRRSASRWRSSRRRAAVSTSRVSLEYDARGLPSWRSAPRKPSRNGFRAGNEVALTAMPLPTKRP